MKRRHRLLRWLRPLLPPLTLGMVALVAALAQPEAAPVSARAPDAAELVQRYERWWAGLDGGASLSTRLRDGLAAAPPCVR